MKIASVHLFRYEIPLTRFLVLGGQTLPSRSGILVKIISESGKTGWGDIAPFPPYSRESLNDTVPLLKEICRSLPGREMEPDSMGVAGTLAAFKIPLPSVSFGLETAMLHLAAEITNVALSRVISSEPASVVYVSRLLDGDTTRIVKGVERSRDEGYSIFKVKVGRQKIEQDIDLVRKLSMVLSENDMLRLDANRAWNLEEAVQFGCAIKDLNVEYIEEPISDPSKMGEFHERTELPVALDESLAERPVEWCLSLSGVSAFVLKPTVLGGIHACLALAKAAAQQDILSVVSSSFESGVGLSAAAHLAASLGDPTGAAGLDTTRWFQWDVLKNDWKITSGELVMSSIGPGMIVVDEGKLSRLSDD